jgi:hypothetical protein
VEYQQTQALTRPGPAPAAPPGAGVGGPDVSRGGGGYGGGDPGPSARAQAERSAALDAARRRPGAPGADAPGGGAAPGVMAGKAGDPGSAEYARAVGPLSLPPTTRAELLYHNNSEVSVASS